MVLGAYAEDILDRVDFGTALVAINPGWEEGLASSLRVGFDLLTRDPRFEAAFVVLGDQPQIPPEVPAACSPGPRRAAGRRSSRSTATSEATRCWWPGPCGRS